MAGISDQDPVRRPRRGSRWTSIARALRWLLGPGRDERNSEPFQWKLGNGHKNSESRQAWWSITTGREPREIALLLGIADELPSLTRGQVLGLGFGFAGAGPWRPLLVIDAARAGVPPEPLPIERRLLGRDLPWLTFGPLSDVQDPLVLPTSLPEPLMGPPAGALVRAKQGSENATLGVKTVRSVGIDRWQSGFLTCGHAFADSVGEQVLALPRGKLRRAIAELFQHRGLRPIGRVVAAEAPVFPYERGSPAAFDFAVVDLDDASKYKWDPSCFVASLPKPPEGFRDPERVYISAGVSGPVSRASIMGALMTMQSWKDCWLLGPTSALRKGDSGSAVASYETHEHLGLVVGRSALADEAQHLYVQCLERLMAERLHPLDVRVELNSTAGGKE